MKNKPSLITVNVFLSLIFLVFISGCQTRSESTEKNILGRAAVVTVSKMDKRQGNSFSWHKGATKLYTSPKIDDPEAQQVLENAIHNSLTKKGYIFNQRSLESDFFVAYVGALESSLSSLEIAEIYGIDPGFLELSNDLNDYEKGTLIILVFDTRGGSLLWRGVIQGEVKIHSKPKFRSLRTQQGVDRLLQDFPNA